MEYSVENGTIICKTGIPLLPRYLVDERVACEIDETGFRSIDYFNAATTGSFRILYPEFWGGIRFYLREGNELFSQDLKNTRLLPFGFESEWNYKGYSFPYRQAVFDDCIMIQLTAPKELADSVCLQMEFYEASFLSPEPNGDIRYRNGTKRIWEPWREEDGYFCGGFTENPPSPSCGICIGSDRGFTAVKSERNYKYRLTGSPLLPREVFTFIMAFDTAPERAKSRCGRSIAESRIRYEAQIARYRAVAERAPVLKSPYPALDRFFLLAPLYHESLKIREYPGAIRAKSTYYWVWGWDGMTSNDAAAYWGDLDFIGKMLAFYRDYADEHGIAHAFSRSMVSTDPAPLPAQGMYLTLLYLYYANGGGIGEFYPFAKLIFEMMCETEAGDSGFCSGTSLFPDHRALLDENGHDISGFNNTVFYCAARSMEVLADVFGDEEESLAAQAIAERMEQNFRKLFYDKEKKYIVCSIDSETFQKRDIFNANAMKWENSFLKDLADGMGRDALSFFRDHIVTDAGLREIPAWCKAYDLDANQLHCWWPVTGEYFARLFNEFDDRALAEKWISWVSYWTDSLLCPEGISCYINTKTPPPDNWNCQNGTWHAYSMRGWYQAAVHAIVGIDADAGGLTFYPYTGEDLTLSGFHYRGGSYTVRMSGTGRYLRKICSDRFEVQGTNKLPRDLLPSDPSAACPLVITVYRTGTNPWPVSILDGTGIAITGFSLSSSSLRANLSGHGHMRLRIRFRSEAAEHLRASLDGLPVTLVFLYDDIAALDIDFRKTKTRQLSVDWEEEPEQVIWQKEPAYEWQDGMPLGNGRIGLMVRGLVKEERIGLNEDTLWAGYPVRESSDRSRIYQAARKLVTEGKKKEAELLLENEFGGPLIQPYLPMGDLILTMDHAEQYENYRLLLHLNTAESEVWYRSGGVGYHRQIFVSEPDQCAVIRLDSDEPGKLSFRLALTGRLSCKVTAGSGGELVMDGRCPTCVAEPGGKYSADSLVYSDDPVKQGISFRTILKVIPTGGTMDVREGTLSVTNASEAVLLLTVRTTFAGPRSVPFPNAICQEDCRSDMDRIVSKSFASVRFAHIFDYRSLYGRTSFSLSEEGTSLLPAGERLKRHMTKRDPGLYTLLFQFGKYLLISCSREGTRAANLQGIWNDRLFAPWSSNYTLNINTEMNYWPALRLNLPECLEPLTEFVKALAENGKEAAKLFYNAPGFVSHHASDLWCTAWPSTNFLKGSTKWGLWPMSGGWLARSLFERYEYTEDLDFLKKTAYPILTECARFFESMLIKQNGSYLFSPATSPENSYLEGGETLSISITTENAMAIVRDVFAMLLKAGEVLGEDRNEVRDPFRERIRAILPELKGIETGSDGRILEWDREYEEAEPHHRHLSHLYALYPGEEFIPQIDPYRKEACEKTLYARGAEGTGWSLAWKLNLWARLGNASMAETLLNMQLRPVSGGTVNMSGGGSYRNLLCAHPPFQIDGNFGVCAGIMEMLVRQHGNTLYLLPALPDAWKCGRLSGLALKGGAILNLAWENGHVTEAKILPLEKRKDYKIETESSMLS